MMAAGSAPLPMPAGINLTAIMFAVMRQVMKMATTITKRPENLVSTETHYHAGVSQRLSEPSSVAEIGQHTPGDTQRYQNYEQICEGAILEG